MSGGTLIVGAGPAAVQLAVSLREHGDEDAITIVGAEANSPYQRPPLSKAFLKGDSTATDLELRSDGFYQRARITIVRSTRIAEVALDGDGPSGRARTAEGGELQFQQLALTVGARPRRLKVEGAQLGGVSYLRDLRDAECLRRHLDGAGPVVVIGGGFIGLEAAAIARQRGHQVTVVERADRLIPRAVAPIVSDFYRDAHGRRGIAVRLNEAVVRLHGRAGRVTSVELAGGVRLPADVVVVGIGVEPRTELAEQLGLECEGGIVVDAFARTSNPNVVAAGDCTVLPDPTGGSDRVRLESVQNAVDQAKCAAATIAGSLVPYLAVPWFWSDQADLKLQIAGRSAGFDDYVIRGDRSIEKFSVLYYRNRRLVAIDCVNRPQDWMAVRRALGAGHNIDPAAVADCAIPLQDMVAA